MKFDEVTRGQICSFRDPVWLQIALDDFIPSASILEAPPSAHGWMCPGSSTSAIAGDDAASALRRVRQGQIS